MIDEPRIVQTAAQQTAVIHLTVPRDQIQEVMGPGYTELMKTIKDQFIFPTGPWFTHHFKIDDRTFDFEIGVPIDKLVAPMGRVKPGSLPAARVARTIYHGPYDGLSDAWATFDEWIKKQGHKPAGDLWEVYLANPESHPDSSDWRTELNRPLK